ncbi:MAG: hypothetical protein JXR03_19390 [Cyclobacteriaceae bacterium]
MKFVEVNGGADSLKVTFDFEDGNGDIGMTDADVRGKFAPFFPVIYYDSLREWRDDDDNIRIGGFFNVTLSDPLVKPPFYLGSESGISDTLFSEVDSRPPFDCQNYFFENGLADTFYVYRNPFHSNFHLKFFKKRNGNYFETSIAQEFNIDDCNQVNEILRIPVFDSERFGKPTIGNITYSYLSNGIVPFLAQDTFKLQFFVYDLELNKSNVIDTPDFLLSDIASN